MLTPEQAQDLVKHFGGTRPAAREIGVPYETFRGWVRPDHYRALRRKYYRANPEPALARSKWRYHGLSGVEYARVRLQNRRVKALRRMAERNRRREQSGSL